MEEKRRHPRVAIELNVTCELANQPEFTGRVTDLSVGGAFIESDTVPAFGAKVTIRARLGSTDVALPGLVRWTKPGGFGVQFGLLGARDTHAITSVVRRK